MRNLIGMSVLASLLLIPGSAITANAGASVSVSVNVGTPFSAWCDDDLDWENAIVIDDSRIGFWVMMPSGRWVFRYRSMWWNASYDDWCFGPWAYDYSIAYRCHCRGHYHGYCPYHAVRFHVYMHNHYQPWHARHFSHHNGRYVRHTVSRHHEPARIHEARRERINDRPAVVVRESSRPSRTNERTTVIVRESKPPVRIDGGTRDTRVITPRSGNNNRDTRVTTSRSGSNRQQPSVNRSSSPSRESGNRNGNVTRTETRRNPRSR